MPKDKGGLGIKNLQASNVALLSKWRWRFLAGGENLWLKVLSCRYVDMATYLDGGKDRYRNTDFGKCLCGGMISQFWGQNLLMTQYDFLAMGTS